MMLAVSSKPGKPVKASGLVLFNVVSLISKDYLIGLGIIHYSVVFFK